MNCVQTVLLELEGIVGGEGGGSFSWRNLSFNVKFLANQRWGVLATCVADL